MVGDSAGGSLAAAVALAARDRGGPGICTQVLLYPGLDRDMGPRRSRSLADAPMLARDDIVYMHDLRRRRSRTAPATLPGSGLCRRSVRTAAGDRGDRRAATRSGTGASGMRTGCATPVCRPPCTRYPGDVPRLSDAFGRHRARSTGHGRDRRAAAGEVRSSTRSDVPVTGHRRAAERSLRRQSYPTAEGDD